MASATIRNVVILGTGPSGLTSAVYSARANLKPLVLHGDTPGGQLTTTTEVENYPGFIEGIDGNELITAMSKQAERFGAEFRYSVVKEVDFSSQPLKLKTSEETILTKSLVIATGARPRKLGIPSETKYWAKGVTSCATCDGFFYRGKEVCVIGGGDSAMEEATFLTRFCTKVYLIHRRGKFRASKIMGERLLKNPKIEVKWNSVIDEIVGKEKVTGVKLKDVNSGKIELLPLSGVFLAIGHIPNTEPFRNHLKLDENGYIITKSHSTQTNVPGVFASGDCQDHVFRQAITAAGTGCMAAIEAERWLETQGQ
jgi:thioredoxin reductase (NADPH)